MADEPKNPRSKADQPKESTDAPEDDILGGENEDEEGGAITGATEGTRRIVLTKRTYLLFAFILITILSILATIYIFFFYLEQYDYPPTEYSRQSLQDTINALTALTFITPLGFVILKFRITNLLIGMLYLFLLVLCLIFPAKGIAESLYSWRYDKENTIQNFAKNPALENKIHNFWAVFQDKFKCCGTKEVDRVEDWPYFLNSTDFPASCCSESQKMKAKDLNLQHVDASEIGSGKRPNPELDQTINYCGLGFGRTRTKGLGFNKATLFKRVFSGFFVSLTEKQIKKMAKTYGMSKNNHGGFEAEPEKFTVDMLDIIEEAKNVEVTAWGSFRRMWKNFYIDSVCNLFDDLNVIKKSKDPNFVPDENLSYCTTKAEDYDNDIAYPSDLNHTSKVVSLGIIQNLTKAIEACKNEGFTVFENEMKKMNKTTRLNKDSYCAKILGKTRQNATTIGRELLLQMDYLTAYIYEYGNLVPNSAKLIPPLNTWMLWPVPTQFDMNETYPYKLNANYVRVANIHKQKDATQRLKKMYYFSRGISENFILQSHIHDSTCESLNPAHRAHVKKKLARDLNKRWRKAPPYSEWKNRDEGLGYFFLEQIRLITYGTMIVCSSCIFCVVILAIVFWQYYSRIKAEEYANLALPKEFEVLHLRRGSLIDEADIAKEIIRPKKKLVARRLPRISPALHGGLRASRQPPPPPGFGRGPPQHGPPPPPSPHGPPPPSHHGPPPSHHGPPPSHHGPATHPAAHPTAHPTAHPGHVPRQN